MICLESLSVRNRKWAVVWCGKHRQTPGQKYFSPHFPRQKTGPYGEHYTWKDDAGSQKQLPVSYRTSVYPSCLRAPTSPQMQPQEPYCYTPWNHVCFLNPSVSPFHYFLSSFRVLFSQGNAFYFQKPNWIFFFPTASTDTAEWQQIESGHRVASWG